MANSLQQLQKQPFSAYVTSEKVKQSLTNAYGDKGAQRFIASITSAVTATPALQKCEFPTIVAAAMLGEALNLSPSPQLGQFYMVPFAKNTKLPNGQWETVYQAQFILGYKGYLQLAMRSNEYVDIGVMEIRAGEYLGKDPRTGKPRFAFIEDDDAREGLPISGYMAYFELRNGFVKTLYWGRQKMLDHAHRFSKAFDKNLLPVYEKEVVPLVTRQENGERLSKQENEKVRGFSSFWYKDFDGMAFKTMLRQLISKWGIMSLDMQRAFENDGDSDYIDIPSGSANDMPDFANDSTQEAEQPEVIPSVDEETGEIYDVPPPEQESAGADDDFFN